MRTDAEVTAAAERTADLALRCAALTRQVEALEGQVAAVRAALPVDEAEAGFPLLATRAALDPDPAEEA